MGVTNRFKGLDLITLSMIFILKNYEWRRHCARGSDQNHPQEEEMQNTKWLSEEVLQIAEKRREAKGKG